MKNPIDDFVDALTYAVKEEVVENYFLQRRVIEEELAEVDRLKAEVDDQRRQALRALAELEELLLEEGFRRAFWGQVGLDDPSPATDPEGDWSAGRVWSRSAPGFGWRGRYRGLIKETIRSLGRAVEFYREVLGKAVSLAAEVNGDIDHFHANFDFLALRSMLCQMDPVEVEKKYILGSDIQGQACLDLDSAMRFERVSPPAQGPLPDLPPEEPLLRAGAKAAALVLKQRPDQVRAKLRA